MISSPSCQFPRACGQQKDTTDPKLDVAVLSAQVINANVTAPVYVLRYSFYNHRDSSNI